MRGRNRNEAATIHSWADPCFGNDGDWHYCPACGEPCDCDHEDGFGLAGCQHHA